MPQIIFTKSTVTVDQSIINRVAFSKSNFYGNTIRIDFKTTDDYNALWPALQNWRKTKNTTKKSPIIKFGDLFILDAGSVHSALVSEAGSGKFSMYKVEKTELLNRNIDFDNWNTTFTMTEYPDAVIYTR